MSSASTAGPASGALSFASTSVTDESTIVDIISPTLGMPGVARGLTNQADALRLWVGPLMASLRLADNAATGGAFAAAGGRRRSATCGYPSFALAIARTTLPGREVLDALALPRELFTPVFAIGRVAGWAAHVLEQEQSGRLIRPQSHYVGPAVRPLRALAG